ncbi:lysophospholipase [Pedobacter sp. HMF7647]|uniref:Lysophospholipase n=1 Tax=Hufsiella arboris TaxID=2695275 RepID=A0A7K1YC48_9SPHI|nr:SGNH/GDSL hydrolase family protein [Hufsiella arboris]MXV52145.1 lysophospholipase [Hufsiella arboris]
MINSRRTFIKSAAIGSIAGLLVPEIVSAAKTPSKQGKITLQDNDIILFQGDSITDSGRQKNNAEKNNNSALGNGYALLTAARLLQKYPEKNLSIYNRGISGNKVYQLAERWEDDCLNLKPTILSILIGVNDFWHTLTGGYKGTVTTYKNDFEALLDKTKQKLPNVKLIIGQPFALTGVKAVDSSWFPAFTDYQNSAREIADKYQAHYIPYQKIFDQAAKTGSPSYWTGDGVHPSLAGGQLMAESWLDLIK